MKNDLFKLAAKVVEKTTIHGPDSILAEAGRLLATDFDIAITAPSELPDGLYDKRGAQIIPKAEAEENCREAARYVLSQDLRAHMTLPFDLPAALRDVAHAVPKEERRYYLNGVFFHWDDKGFLRLCATDGHRLALREVDVDWCSDGSPTPESFTLPRKVVEILTTWKGGGNWDLRILAGNVVAIKETDSGFTITTKLINGTYPDYWRVVPRRDRSEDRFEGDAKPMLAMFKEFNSYSRERSKKIVLRGDHTARMTPPDYVPKEAATPCFWHTGHRDINSEIGFNCKYLVDAFSVLAGHDFIFQQQDSASPALIVSEGRPELLQVIMPLRV